MTTTADRDRELLEQAGGALWKCVKTALAADPVQRADRRTRWVMDLTRYRQIRAASEAHSEEKTDLEKWVPESGDLLCGIPVEVREDGGEPHLETPPYTPNMDDQGTYVTMTESEFAGWSKQHGVRWEKPGDHDGP